MKEVKQLVDRVLAKFETWKSKMAANRRTVDNTVEGQARAFRLWIWSSAAGLLVLVIGSAFSLKSESNTHEGKRLEANASQFPFEKIPEGFVLVPIEPVNTDALDSVFESFGYADLYESIPEGGRGRRIIRGAPLLRAPLNRRRFAVLADESIPETVAKLGNPVLVVLRRGPLSDDQKSKSGASTQLNQHTNRGSVLSRAKNEGVSLVIENTFQQEVDGDASIL